MDRVEIEAKVKSIVAKELGFKEDQIENANQFKDDLGMDSLETVDLVLTIEDEFGCEIPDEDIENIKTVQDLINYIADKEVA